LHRAIKNELTRTVDAHLLARRNKLDVEVEYDSSGNVINSSGAASSSGEKVGSSTEELGARTGGGGATRNMSLALQSLTHDDFLLLLQQVFGMLKVSTWC